MKLGLGLYRDLLSDDNFRFARQAGCTHIVAHLTNYFAGASPNLASGGDEGWGSCEGAKLWSQDELDGLVSACRRHGIEVAALENLNPAFWHDVLLDGPQRDRQLEDLKMLIRRVGRAGIPVIGYNFSIAGVWGWFKEPAGRGSAMSVGFDAGKCDVDRPIPKGMVWNMRYASERRAVAVSARSRARSSGPGSSISSRCCCRWPRRRAWRSRRTRTTCRSIACASPRAASTSPPSTTGSSG